MNAAQFIREYNPGLSQFCSAVITKDGDVIACSVSHLKTMIELYGDAEILAKIPDGQAPLFWLINHLGCVLVDYENQIFSGELTREQQQALSVLVEAKRIVPNYKNIHGHL